MRSVDVVPTILDLLKIPTEKMDFDGVSPLSVIARRESEECTAYAECLYDFGNRRDGELQAFRTDKFKFMRDLTKGTEEFYYLEDDPLEQNNLMERIRESKRPELENIRRKLNSLFFKTKGTDIAFSNKEKEEIRNRLRSLGYMEW